MVGTGGYRSFLAAQSPIQSVSMEKLGLQGLGPRGADPEIHGNYSENYYNRTGLRRAACCAGLWIRGR